MPNTNCLEGFKCPNCGFEDAFSILMTAYITLYDDGTDPHGDTDWGQESECECTDCGWAGKVEDFRPEG